MGLPTEIKTRWLHALRHDEYKQADEVLCRRIDDYGSSGYCCLGVLVDVLEPGKLNTYYGEDFLDECITNNTEFIEDHGLEALCAKVDNSNSKYAPGSTYEDVLVNMNDGGKTFAEIADWIEEHL
jgi:hypothetical protein